MELLRLRMLRLLLKLLLLIVLLLQRRRLPEGAELLRLGLEVHLRLRLRLLLLLLLLRQRPLVALLPLLHHCDILLPLSPQVKRMMWLLLLLPLLRWKQLRFSRRGSRRVAEERLGRGLRLRLVETRLEPRGGFPAPTRRPALIIGLG